MTGIKKEEVKKGKATKTMKPSWIKMEPVELEKIVVDLAKKGESPAKIGLILRDKYGVPKAKVFGKKVTQILKGKEVKYESDKDVVDKKVGTLKGHISRNRHDYAASRALTKRLWDIYRINKRAQ
ncbi:MAG: hypothetical protein ABIH92_02565 [Nanoarchaeota archaeon]